MGDLRARLALPYYVRHWKHQKAANLNAIHFAIRMAALKSKRVVGCSVRGRRG